MMRSRVAFVVTVLAVAGTCWAGRTNLTPRAPTPKTPTAKLAVPEDGTGRLTVKFIDPAKARALGDGRIEALSSVRIDSAAEVLARFGLTARCAFNQSEEFLAGLETKAAFHSNKAQPDLAGMMHLEGPRQNMLAAARALNELDVVEWVQFEPTYYFGGDPRYPGPDHEAIRREVERERAGGPGGDPQEALGAGACCTPGGTCLDGEDAASCDALGGQYLGDGTVCAPGVCGVGACCEIGDVCNEGPELWCLNERGGTWFAATCDSTDCDNDCGQVPHGCFDVEGHAVPFCSDEICCNLVCQIDEYCCDEDLPGAWDPFCAAEANYLCDPHTTNWDPYAIVAVDAATNTVSVAGNVAGNFLDGDTVLIAGSPANRNDGKYAVDGNSVFDGLNTNVVVDGDLTDNTPGGNLVKLVDPPAGPDHCASPLNDSCFEDHFRGGCNNQPCCNIVCTIDPVCCLSDWDLRCVSLALSQCTRPLEGGSTPDYEPLQGYLRRGSYLSEGGIPPDLAPYIPLVGGFPFLGWGGHGWNLETAGEPYTDENDNEWYDLGEPFEDVGRDGIPDTFDEGEGNGLWDSPGGLRGIAETLFRGSGIDGCGKGNLTLGRGTKIAVIEWAYWDNHEDLDVTTERGQTLIKIPDITEPDHGTACLSIINAKDDGKGVTGLVPKAKGFFYPLTSVEEGPRELSAWASAIADLGPGDVISASYGPGRPIGNLNNDLSHHAVLTLAADAGIISCVAAGNACYNLDDAEDRGDSGALVIGACSPGFPFYRLAFSNYCTAPSNDRSNIVHLKAWGEAVASAGYGILPVPDADITKRYTPIFNGTSAAAPQVAGLVAALQALAKQFYGIALSPEQLRAVTGAPGIPPGNPPRLFGGFGEPGTDACYFDVDPESGPNMIGVYPSPVGGASRIVTQSFAGFDGSPNVDDVVIVRGDRVVGNKFSIKARENTYLSYDAIYTDRDDGGIGDVGRGNCNGNGTPVPEIENIEYLASGFITDMIVVGHSELDTVNTMILENEIVYPPAGVFFLMFVEAYDWRRQEFSFIDVVSDPGQAFSIEEGTGDLTFAHVADAPSRFINVLDDRILFRIWTLGFPNTFRQQFGGDDNYRMIVDYENIFLHEQAGEELPGGDG